MTAGMPERYVIETTCPNCGHVAKVETSVEALSKARDWARSRSFEDVLPALAVEAVRPETDIDEERSGPVVRTHETFGDWIDFGRLDADSIIVSGNDGFGRKPLRLLLPHQLYVKDVGALLEKHPRIEVMPVRSREWIDVNRILAAYRATPLTERPE